MAVTKVAHQAYSVKCAKCPEFHEFLSGYRRQAVAINQEHNIRVHNIYPKTRSRF